MTTQPARTNRPIERLLARLRRKNKEIEALQSEVMSREIELDGLCQENTALVCQLADAQLIIDGQAHRIRHLNKECQTYLEMTHEAIWHHVGFDDRVIRPLESRR